MQKIIDTFQAEFGLISDKFIIISESVGNLLASKKEFIYNPGVYVFYLNDNVIKVGRHLKNSRKRAYQHITDNTKNEGLEMKDLRDNPEAKVLLINVKSEKDVHWIAAAEIFLETELKPIIKSKRM